MTCRELRPYVVDLARGAIDAAAVESRVARHVRSCSTCRALLERERIMSAALQRMAAGIHVPPASADREHALLTRFDEARAKPTPPRVSFWLWSPAVAAVLLIAVVAGWRSWGLRPAAVPAVPTHRAPGQSPDEAIRAASRLEVVPGAAKHPARPWPARRAARRAPAPTPSDDTLEPSLQATSFVSWPGAAAGPPLESGSVVRVSLPVSILPALGLWPPPSAGSTVPVDLLIGQDGFARAVRLVSE